MKQSELPAYVLAVKSHTVGRDAQEAGDLLTGVPMPDEFGYLDLRAGQRA